MQTADIAKSTQCWCERIWAADLARSAPLPLKWFFSTPAHRSTPAHAVFRPLRSVFRSAHILWFSAAACKYNDGTRLKIEGSLNTFRQDWYDSADARAILQQQQQQQR